MGMSFTTDDCAEYARSLVEEMAVAGGNLEPERSRVGRGGLWHALADEGRRLFQRITAH